MDQDIFQVVSPNERPKIIEALNESWPKHFLLQQFITLLSENANKTTNFLQTLYHSGDNDNRLYLVETRFSITPSPFSLFFIYTTSTNLAVLNRTLLETRVVPWESKRFVFEVTLNRFTPFVGRVFVSKGLRALVQHYSLLWLPPETPVDRTEPPEDVYIDMLDQKHVVEVAENWPGFPGHDRFIAEEISINQGFGVFRKSDGKMLSSILSFHSGGIFMLYSIPVVRRKGYGELVLRHIINSVRKQNIVPFCTVFRDNFASQKLVKKLGFVQLDNADYIFPSDILENG